MIVCTVLYAGRSSVGIASITWPTVQSPSFQTISMRRCSASVSGTDFLRANQSLHHSKPNELGDWRLPWRKQAVNALRLGFSGAAPDLIENEVLEGRFGRKADARKELADCFADIVVGDQRHARDQRVVDGYRTMPERRMKNDPRRQPRLWIDIDRTHDRAARFQITVGDERKVDERVARRLGVGVSHRVAAHSCLARVGGSGKLQWPHVVREAAVVAAVRQPLAVGV